MAILGQIRKRSIFLILVIGMALFAFVISGVFTSNGGFSSNQPIGDINGEEIDFETFNQIVDQAQSVYGMNTINAVNFAWDQSLRIQALNQELDKLGIDAGKNQLEQIISNDNSISQNPLFLNEIGFFDFNKFSDYISQLRSSNPNLYNQWKFDEENIISVAKQKIYFDMIRSSVKYTDFESSLQYHIENDKVNLEYLRIPYETISDSLINIRDSEIMSYVKDNRDNYESSESKEIDYIFIEDIASSLDLNNIRTNLEQLRDGYTQLNQVSDQSEYIVGFKDSDDFSEFIEIYSDVSWDSIYKTKQELSSEFSDILYGLKVGDVFGPYRDENSFKISKMIDKKREDNLNKVLIADVVKEILPSNESSNSNFRSASQAEFDANNGLALNNSNPGITINSFESFDEFDSSIPGFINSRQVVKWLHDKSTKVGDVKRFNIDNGYLVAKVKSFNNKSLPKIDDVRDEVSQILKIDKKYKYIQDKHGKLNEIEALSDEYDIELERASAVTQYDPLLVGAGAEPYIIGSAFALEVDETSDFLKGKSGIYLIRIISKVKAEEINITSAISRSLADKELQRLTNLIPEVLESKAEITDNRNFYY